MKENFKRLAILACLVVPGLSFSDLAHAERIVAARGSAANEWDRDCFRHDYGRVSNTCAGEVSRFSVGVRTVSGSRQFKATGCDPGQSGGDTTCSAVVTDEKGWVKSATGDWVLSHCGIGSPNATTINLGSALAVASTDGVVFECLIQNQILSFVGTLDY